MEAMQQESWMTLEGLLAIGLAFIFSCLYFFVWNDEEVRQRLLLWLKAHLPTRRPPVQVRSAPLGIMPAAGPSAAPAPLPASGALPERTWIDMINRSPDAAPHVLVIGGTGAGKTTLVRPLLAAREGQIAILDPKWQRGKWGGLPAAAPDEHGYGPLEELCRALLSEYQRRLRQHQQGTAVVSPLTVFVDDFPDVVEECATAPVLFRRIAQMGRELRIRLVILSQSDRVKALGLEGRGDVRKNFVTIRLGDDAREVMPGLPAGRVAVMSHAGGWREIAMPTPESPARWSPTQVFVPVRGVDFLVDSALANQFDEPDTLVRGDTSAVRDFGTLRVVRERSEPPAYVAIDDDHLIAELVRRGASANTIATVVGGTRQVVLDKVRNLRGAYAEKAE